MAVVDVNLAGGGTTTISESDANDGDLLNITALGDHTLIVDNVNVSIQSILGVELASSPTFQAQNGGSLTLDQGLLNISALDAFTFNIVDDGEIILDGSGLSVGSGITNLLSSYHVDFSGATVGRFEYDPPGLSVLGAINFNVTGMQAGDELDLGGESWAGSSYNAVTEVLTLEYGTGFGGALDQNVYAHIEMSPADYAIFSASEGTYLSGGDFTYPGIIVCFGSGTRILTIDGYLPVESLRKGMLLRTYDGSLAPIVWVGCSTLDAYALDLLPNMWPIRIGRDALGTGFPERDLEVSPQHRIFVNGHSIHSVSEAPFGLLAAKHMTDLPGIDVVRKPAEVTYYHILLENHEVIWAENLPTESMYIGPYTARSLNPGTRSEIEQLIPEYARRFKSGADTKYSLLKKKDAFAILKNAGAKRNEFFAPGKIRQHQKRVMNAEKTTGFEASKEPALQST
ncbi:Hint domain-containing protein [Pseudooceanicola algae]|uniref:Hedgehog/Intein (Hint) domain-containing protein n=1 Tax=Pseudooceanicola algae TaxID=1537215 RepID=A0A418SJ30_9RHOB|nr:Hint domain-containing protein [Pseudooceanicola algae]QPM91984.1 hypothetical protein PSAL_032470 [Pseudooceanicola algae]